MRYADRARLSATSNSSSSGSPAAWSHAAASWLEGSGRATSITVARPVGTAAGSGAGGAGRELERRPRRRRSGAPSVANTMTWEGGACARPSGRAR